MTRFRYTVVLVLFSAGGSALSGQTIAYEGAISMSSGSYIFTEKTTSWTLSSGLALSAGPLTLRATVPVNRHNTSLLTVSGTRVLPTGGSASGAVADSSAARKGGGHGGGGPGSQLVGVLPSLSVAATLATDPVEVPTSSVTGYEVAAGDPMVTVNAVLSESGPVMLTAGVGAKVPFNDTTSYGTGKWDLGGSLSVSYRVGFRVLFGVDAGYWHYGDLPELDLRDGLLGSASVAYLGSGGWGGSAFMSAARSVIDGFADCYVVGVSLTRLGRLGAFSINTSVGLTEMTPDFTAGASWRVGIK